MIKILDKISRKHYIQCALAVLFTGVALYFTSYLWMSKGILVSFHAQADNDIEYRVYYTDASKQQFSGVRSLRKNVKSGSSFVEIMLPVKKIVKFRLDFSNNPGKIEITDLRVSGSKDVVLNGNKFDKHQIDSYEVNGNKIILSSSKKDPYIPYKKELNLSGKNVIDWLNLIIISVFVFLLVYKFIQYLSEFKTEKQYSRLDILMLAVFFGLLFVPMSHISDATKSEQEKRMLAKKPHFTLDEGENYGPQFDAWYNDHFFGRGMMIYMYNYIRFFITPMGENRNAMIGKNGFLWSKAYNTIDMYRNFNLFSNDELKIAAEHIVNFVREAQKAGVKNVYFMLSNDKESMYPEYYPSYIKKVGKVSRLEQLLKYIHNNYPQVKFLNFRDKFEDIKRKDIVFSKTGTHMNMIGGFYEYYFLINEIKKDYPEIIPISLDHFDIKYSEDMKQPGMDLSVYNKFMMLPRYGKSNFGNKVWNINLNIKSHRTKRKSGDFTKGINDNSENGVKVFMIGDSFSLRYYKYLLGTFHKVDRVFIGGGKDFDLTQEEQKYILNNIPDILIVESTERFLQRFLTLEFPTNPSSSKKEK